jgi:hypothetical protein
MLRKVRDIVGRGSRNQWWSWFQVASPRDWSVEAVARLVLEEPGELADHKELRRIRTVLGELGLAIDATLAAAAEKSR